MNTRIQYLYRDADNYKQWTKVVIAGKITKNDIKRIASCVDNFDGDTGYFIPRQVGLPENRFDRFDPQSDHAWFELSIANFEPTNAPVSENLTVSDLVASFEAAKDNWDEEAYLMDAEYEEVE